MDVEVYIKLRNWLSFKVISKYFTIGSKKVYYILIMIKFEGEEFKEFYSRFGTEDSCKKYLSDVKWKDGFTCVKCIHTGFQARANYSRTCNKCSYTESPSANTLFHKVKFGLDKAFVICFEMTTTTRSLSASHFAERLGVTPYTARMFMYKVRAAMKSNG